MVTRVYFWKPSGVKSFGHISLELSDNFYVSWWPSEEMERVTDALAGSSAKWYDNFESELKKNGSPDKTYYLFGLNEENIKEFFNRFKEGSKKWDLLKRSCSNVTYNALCEGAEWFRGRADGPTTPEAIAGLVEAYMNNKEEKKVKLASFCK